MIIRVPRFAALFLLVILPLSVTVVPTDLLGQAGGGSAPKSGSSSSAPAPEPTEVREKSPTLDPAGPMISLITAEPVFFMAAGLNACGYNDGLEESAPQRQWVRGRVNEALSKSEDARQKRDKLCLYVAQHRMTGSVKDVSQYISLSLYLSQPPELELTAELTQMPPDSTQIAEVAPLLREFAEAVGLHEMWATVRHEYDQIIGALHRPLSEMIVGTNAYLKMPASTYNGRRFIVVLEPMLSPRTVNARIYGTDYVVVISPSNGMIRMGDVRHTYLHYLIEPLLLQQTVAVSRMQPIIKEVSQAPLAFVFRSDVMSLVVECLIKAIEARTMDTGIANYKMPAGIDRSQRPQYERERDAVRERQEVVRQQTVQKEMRQGFVLAKYFYDELKIFEGDPASLGDSVGEMVYTIDPLDAARLARRIEFDKEATEDVLARSKPRKLEGMDLAEARLAAGDLATAGAMARQALTVKDSSLDAVAQSAQANFILARVAALSGHPEEAVKRFQTTLTTSKDSRMLSWSHIYLGRMLDLDCKRDQAVDQYKLAMEKRDSQQDTRLAAERGLKEPYTVQGHGCDVDDDEDGDAAEPPATKEPPVSKAPAEMPKR